MNKKWESAFPNPEWMIKAEKIERKDLAEIFVGLSKRELFAAMAMQGLVSNPYLYSEEGKRISVTISAVSVADALLAELSKNEEDLR